MIRWAPLAVALFPSIATSQITLTSSDMPQAGTTYPVENALLAFEDYTSTGENFTWDFAGITGINEAPVTPSSMAEASITASVAFNNPFNASYQCHYFLPTDLPALPDGIGLDIPLDGFNSFFQTEDHMGIAGIGLSSSGFDLPVQYSDIDEWFPLPLNFGTVFESTGAFSLNLDGLFGYEVDQTRSVSVDGWGTLILPGGPHEVLRIRTELEATDAFLIPQIGEDPIVIDRSQVIYSWYGVGTGVPLLEVTETFGVAAQVTFQNLTAPEPNHVAALGTRDSFKVWPNPVAAGEAVSWTGQQDGAWQMFNAQGQLVAQSNGTSQAIIAPEAGLYFLNHSGKLARLVVQ
jgi:hypothetical protein